MSFQVYNNCFGEWIDVVRQFTGNSYCDESKKKALLEQHPEPEEVIYANYDIDGYEGSAFVLWRNGRKYYTLQGSHCSCYGLEEAGFDPEEWKTKKLLREYLEKGTYLYCVPEEVRLQLIKRLK